MDNRKQVKGDYPKKLIRKGGKDLRFLELIQGQFEGEDV